MGRLVAALRAINLDAFSCWLSGGRQDPVRPDDGSARQADGFVHGREPLTRWGRKPAESITQSGEVKSSKASDRVNTGFMTPLKIKRMTL